jgi:hypothetical protein
MTERSSSAAGAAMAALAGAEDMFNTQLALVRLAGYPIKGGFWTERPPHERELLDLAGELQAGLPGSAGTFPSRRGMTRVPTGSRGPTRCGSGCAARWNSRPVNQAAASLILKADMRNNVVNSSACERVVVHVRGGLPELSAELRLHTDDMDDLWCRYVDAAYRPNQMFTTPTGATATGSLPRRSPRRSARTSSTTPTSTAACLPRPAP